MKSVDDWANKIRNITMKAVQCGWTETHMGRIKAIMEGEKMQKPRLLNHTPLEILIRATRTCTATVEKMDCCGDNISHADRELISKKILKQNRYDNAVSEMTSPDTMDLVYASHIIKKLKEPIHDSVLEHLNYTFHLTCSRAVLQELARHRHASLSVQSTRYALKKLTRVDDIEELSDMIAESGSGAVNASNDIKLDSLVHEMSEYELPNDIAKYGLPEAFKTELIWTVNARSLRNFFILRTHRRALREISELAIGIYNELPETHRFIFDDVIWR